MAPPERQMKTMSSRLLTMKFMQRAAGAGTSSGSGGNAASDHRHAKRMRLADGSAKGAASATRSDYDDVKTAIASEELKRTQAIERQATEAGETRWAFSFHDLDADKAKTQGGLKVITRGFADIDKDSDDADEEEEVAKVTGRRVFGTAKENNDDTPSSEESSENEESEAGYDPEDPTAGLIREGRQKAEAKARKSKKKTQRENAAKNAAVKRHKDGKGSKGSKLTSISMGGKNANTTRPLSKGASAAYSDVSCYRCGMKGHLARRCPEAQWKSGKKTELKWNN